MKAKDYLLQVVKLDRLIENKLIEIQQWKAIATGTTAHSEGDRVQSSGSQQKMADAVCRYVSIEEEIDRYIDKLVDIKQEVIKTIEQLPATEYDVLHQIYIQGKTLDDVADRYSNSYSWATTVHGRALKKVQNILDKEKGNDNIYCGEY
jgi:DNA-directed RNA polymerase specialized sigma subunit